MTKGAERAPISEIHADSALGPPSISKARVQSKSPWAVITEPKMN